jgi:hypothetical protein
MRKVILILIYACIFAIGLDLIEEFYQAITGDYTRMHAEFIALFVLSFSLVSLMINLKNYDK